MQIGAHHTKKTREKMSESHKGYNHHFFGKNLLEEHKKKISESQMGNISWNKGLTIKTDSRLKHVTEENKKKLSERSKGNTFALGLHHSEETRMKISKKLKGRKFSEEHKKKLSEANKGKISSEEAIRKNSEGHKNPSKETRRKISEASFKNAKTNPNYGMSGKHHSEETKRKIGAKSKNRYRTEEWRKRVSKANKGKKNPFYGKHHTKEVRKKISAVQQCIPLDEWEGFISFEPYTIDFNKLFKNKIRDRDNHCCVICNKQEEDLGRKLDIHHIDYNKLNSFPQFTHFLFTLSPLQHNLQD